MLSSAWPTMFKMGMWTSWPNSSGWFVDSALGFFLELAAEVIPASLCFAMMAFKVLRGVNLPRRSRLVNRAGSSMWASRPASMSAILEAEKLEAF